MSRLRQLSGIAICIALAFFMAEPSMADITESQQLRFGEWAITNNTTSHSITVDINGNVNTSSGAVIMLSPPQPGIYDVTDLTPLTAIGSVNVTMTQPMTGGGGPNFTVESFTTSIPPTDGAGSTTLTMGATARTSGTSQAYPDDTYTGELHVEINY